MSVAPKRQLDYTDVEVRKFRFGPFEVDLGERELRNQGIRVPLQQKPFSALELLLFKRGSLVTRQELADYLWPNLHVSFERGLNTAINVLRRALGDTHKESVYIETRAGLGYRFIAPVQVVSGTAPDSMPERFQTSHESFEAYEAYLKGRYFYKRMTEEDLRKSIAYFEAALAHDARYAPAFTGLADTYALCALLGIMKPAVARARAIDLAMTALDIEEDLAEVHASLAGIKKLFDWDWNGAEAEYLRALELNPNYADAHRWYAALLCSIGRSEEANREMQAAQRLDPVSLAISADFAWNQFMMRDFEAAAEQAWKTLALEPKYAPAQHTLGLAYEQLGMYEEAITELQNARTCSGEHPVPAASLAHAFSNAGNQDAALQIVCDLKTMSQRRYIAPYWIAVVYAGLDDTDAAFTWLEKAFEERDVWLVWLKCDPRFDALRTKSRFSRLIRNLGLGSDAEEQITITKV